MKIYQSYDNKVLLELLSISDENAFTELYNRYWQKLFVIAFNRLNQMDGAEDIVHDTFAMLWANREKMQIDCLENYLATTTKYMVLAKIKKQHREYVYRHASTSSSPIVDLPVETSLHCKRILEIIKTEVENLPERCRLIFNYSRNEGMPVKQIAHQLSISPKTVENQLNKALKILKLAAQPFFSFLLFFL